MLEEKRKRGGCLSVYLFVAIVFNLIVHSFFCLYPGIYMFFDKEVGSDDLIFPMSQFEHLIFGLLGTLGVIFLIGIWKWKKWAVYGYVINFLIGFVITLMTGGSILLAALPFIGLSILCALISPVWKYME